MVLGTKTDKIGMTLVGWSYDQHEIHGAALSSLTGSSSDLVTTSCTSQDPKATRDDHLRREEHTPGASLGLWHSHGMKAAIPHP